MPYLGLLINLVGFVLLNTAIILVAWAATRRWFANGSLSDALSILIVVWMAFVAGVQLFLGALGLLFFARVLMVGFVLAGGMGITLRSELRSTSWVQDQKRLQVAWLHVRDLLQKNVFLATAALLTLTVAVTRFVNSLTVFTDDVDTLGYHLPMAVSWLKAGSLSAQDSPLWWYPGTSELLILWGLMPVHSEVFMGLVNWISVVLAGLSI